MKRVIYTLIVMVLIIIGGCGKSEEKEVKVTPDSEGYMLVGQWEDEEMDLLFYFDEYGNIHRIENGVDIYYAKSCGKVGTKYMPYGSWRYANGQGSITCYYYNSLMEEFTIQQIDVNSLVAIDGRGTRIELEKLLEEKQIDLEKVAINTGFEEDFAEYLPQGKNESN